MNRRQWLAAGAIALGSACGRKIGAGFPGYALIATAGETSISVIDLSDFQLVKQVQVGGAPEKVFSAPETDHSYVLTPATGSVHAIDASFRRVVSRKLADRLAGLQLTQDGKWLLAILGHGRELLEMEAASFRVTRRWKLSAEPVALDVAVDGSVAISTGDQGIVELIDRKTGQQKRKELSGAIGQARFRADGKLLMVANCKDQALTALDVPSLQVIVDLPLAMQPENLCFNSDGGQLFVSGRGMDGVAIAFTYWPLEVEQTVLGGRDPGVMACAGNTYLLIASASGSDVSILTVARRRMVGIVEVGQKPSYIAITPDNQYALVLNEASGDMAVIHVSSIQDKLSDAAKRRGKAGASLFTMLAVGNQPVHAAIVPRVV